MTSTTDRDRDERKALNRWAVRQGYVNFDVYIATGGSLFRARAALLNEYREIQRALDGLQHFVLDEKAAAEPDDLAAFDNRHTDPAVQGDEA